MAQVGENASAVDAELKDVKQAVKKVEDDIVAITESLKKAKDRAELKFLRAKKMKLRAEKMNLMDQLKQLRDKELKLMDQLKPTGGPQVQTVADIGLQQLKASLLEKNVVPIEGSGMGIIELPRLVNSVEEQTVFMRAIYPALYDMVEATAMSFAKGEDVPNGVVINGNPGIGKSVGLLNYILWQCAQKRRTVVFECLSEEVAYLFDFSDTRSPVLEMMGRPIGVAALKRRETWYLVDPGGTAKEPLHCPAFTIIATSPNRSHYRQFLKDVGWRLWLPVWTVEELQSFAPHYWPNADVEERQRQVKRRFDELGGIPRFVFCNEIKFQEGLSDRDCALTFGAKSLFRFTGSDFESQFAGHRHTIYHAEVDHAFKISRVVFGSPAIARLATELLPTVADDELRSFVAIYSNALAGVQGKVYEFLAFKRLAEAGSHHTYRRRLVHEWDTMQGGKAVPGQEEQVHLHITSNNVSVLEDWSQQPQPGIVYAAKDTNQKSWDGIILQGWEGRDIILQAKYGKTKKPIILKGLQELFKRIPSLGKVGERSRREVDLVVVVPPDQYDKFGGHLSYDGCWEKGKGGPEDSPIIRQYLLSVDVRSYPSLLTPPGTTE